MRARLKHFLDGGIPNGTLSTSSAAVFSFIAPIRGWNHDGHAAADCICGVTFSGSLSEIAVVLWGANSARRSFHRDRLRREHRAALRAGAGRNRVHQRRDRADARALTVCVIPINVHMGLNPQLFRDISRLSLVAAGCSGRAACDHLVVDAAGDCSCARHARELIHCVHGMNDPPVTSSVAPLTKPAASEARYETAAAISAGSPMRPTGMRGR
jgi:hypothetical protein